MHRPRPPIAVLVLSLAATPVGRLGAQWRAELELSGARLRQEEQPSTGAVTIGSTVAHDGSRSALELIGLATFGHDAQRTAQLIGTASLLGAARGPLRWAIGTRASAFTEAGVNASVSGYLTAREQVMFGTGGGWAGLAIGGVQDRGDGFPVRSADAGVWSVLGALDGALTATLVDTRAAYDVVTANGVRLVIEPATYTDVGAMMRWDLAGSSGETPIRLSLHGGARLIARGGNDARRKGFGGADLEVAFAPRVRVAAAIGRQLADLARATPASRYATLGVRLSLHEPSRAPAPVARAPGSGSQTHSPRADIETSDAGSRLVITAPATRVEVVASFTAWEPIALERRDARWILPGMLPPGTHRLLMRIDGGAWMPPPNLASTDDGDGGRVGLVVVP